LLMAGLDGIRNQIDPGAPSDKDLYDLPPEEEKGIPTVCASLDQALEALDGDREFLKAGGVFTDDFIDAYIGLKMKEVTAFRAVTDPLEYQMSCAISGGGPGSGGSGALAACSLPGPVGPSMGRLTGRRVALRLRGCHFPSPSWLPWRPRWHGATPKSWWRAA